MNKGVRVAGLLFVVYMAQCVFAYADQIDNEIRIDLKEDAVVEHSRYMLGDIAQINVEDARIRNELESLLIGRAPRIGYVVKVRRMDLLPRIERIIPGVHNNIVWTGPNFTRVRTLGLIFDKQKVVNAAEHQLHDWLADRYVNFDLKATGNLDDLVLPKGDIELKPRVKDDERLNKRMNVWVDIFVGGYHYQSMPVWFGVSVRAPVLLMTKEAKKGNKIVDGYIAKDVVDIAAVKGVPLQESDIGSKRLQRDLKPGDVITDAVVEEIPDVVKGAQVTVQASSGSVVIKSVAVALGDGMSGEKIKVRKPDTEIEYSVTVIGKNLVSADKE